MNVKQIVARALKAGGYDGLYCTHGFLWNGCHCGGRGICKCGNGDKEHCRAGYLQQADGTIGPRKPKKGKAK